MTKFESYEFSDFADLLGEAKGFYATNKDDRIDPEGFKRAVKEFFETRLNSELLDLQETTIDDNSLSMWDFDFILNVFNEEKEKRSWIHSQEVYDTMRIVLSEWSGTDSLENKVERLESELKELRKKFKRILVVLDSVKLEVSARELVELK